MNRLTRASVILALSIAGIAAATPAWSLPCTDVLCGHEGSNGGGTVAGFSTADNNLANNRFIDGTAVNDRISSVTNKAPLDVMFYTDSYWRGNQRRFSPLGRPENVSVYDNQYSSFRAVL